MGLLDCMQGRENNPAAARQVCSGCDAGGPVLLGARSGFPPTDCPKSNRGPADPRPRRSLPFTCAPQEFRANRVKRHEPLTRTPSDCLRGPMKRSQSWREIIVALALLSGVLWLRWPTFGFSLWNVDESIHAAAARTILDGGVLYRDAIDIRHPLTYYIVAGVFALFGENNLWAVRCLVALLVAGTGWCLYLTGSRLRNVTAGASAAVLYVLLATGVLFQGDANAANTEWFVAFFSSAGAAVFFAGGSGFSPRRLFTTGLLFSCAFLSKQPALLDVAAPMAVLLYTGWWLSRSRRTVLLQIASLIVGWLTPGLLTAGFLAAHGALHDAIFYTWTYNLTYYGPEITLADRLGSLIVPFKLIGASQPWLLGIWAAGAFVILHRLMQRTPSPSETATNPGAVFVVIWSLAGLTGAAASGRSFDHYVIQFLAPFCLGGGLALARLGGWGWSTATRWPVRAAAVLLLAVVGYEAGSTALAARGRTLPEDPSRRVATYIRGHSQPDDRIFVWGFHPDIYLYADRRPASRYLFASFQTGMIPWTNTAPTLDTSYAIVPGTMEKLLADLMARPPAYIVDCSAGPNRYWQKYPPENYPPFANLIRTRYRQVEAHRFVPQGFRLYQIRRPEDPAATEDPDSSLLSPSVTASLQLDTLSVPLTPVRASARYGASPSMVEGRREIFAHAPSSITYRIPAGATALRGGYGIKASAYAEDNPTPTDGAEFSIHWHPTDGGAQVLLHRLLRPREEPTDRGVQSFRVDLPTLRGGELELTINPGPADTATSDWSYWTGLLLENSP